MKVFKKIAVWVILFILGVGMFGNWKTYQGTEELTQKAREELSLSDTDPTEVRYVGMQEQDGYALAWFIAERPSGARTYLPLEFESKANDSYVFKRSYEPMDGRGTDDISVLIWRNEYSILINDPKCKVLRITAENGEKTEIEVETYPFLYEREIVSGTWDYAFLDAKGNEL